MLRQGPLPRFVHGVIEYIAAAAFIAAPFVLDFQSGAATAVSIVVGVVVLLIAATSEGSTSLIDQIPTGVHIALDFVLAVVLIGAPFLFGFQDETEPTAFFIGIGVLHLLVTIATRFVKEERRPAQVGPGGGSGDRARASAENRPPSVQG